MRPKAGLNNDNRERASAFIARRRDRDGPGPEVRPVRVSYFQERKLSVRAVKSALGQFQPRATLPASQAVGYERFSPGASRIGASMVVAINANSHFNRGMAW